MTFIEFAQQHGLLIEYSRFYTSKNIQRCGTLGKPNSKNGAYMWNGSIGWIMDWSSDRPEVIWYRSEPNGDFTKKEKALIEEYKKNAANERVEKEKGYKKASEEAQKRLEKSKSETHPYLAAKGFNTESGFVLDGALLIPMRNVITNDLQGLQMIYEAEEDGKKKFMKKMLPGMRAKDAVFVMGSRSVPESWLVEGYATGKSLHAALRLLGSTAKVIVCFSASNLVNVASKIKGTRFVFADNDKSGTGQRVAKETGLPWISADEEGWDANDIHTNKGLYEVTKKIIELKSKLIV